jgi:hypothetical protein
MPVGRIVSTVVARPSERRIRIIDMIGRRGRFITIASAGFLRFVRPDRGGAPGDLRDSVPAEQPLRRGDHGVDPAGVVLPPGLMENGAAYVQRLHSIALGENVRYALTAIEVLQTVDTSTFGGVSSGDR